MSAGNKGRMDWDVHALFLDGAPIGSVDTQARRLAACWNACKHITTESVEAYNEAIGGVISANGASHIALTAQRDELLAALTELAPFAEKLVMDGVISVNHGRRIRSAIDKAAGEPAHDASLSAIPRESNDALIALAKYWKLDGDWMTCKGCRRSLIASRDGEELAHGDGCKFWDQQHPWAQLRTLITRQPTGAKP